MSDIWFVTGAAGFIGSNLCRHLLEGGRTVVGFDNFLAGSRSNLDRLNALDTGRFRFVEGDILDRPALASAMDGCGPVVHLAAQVSVARSIADPEETRDINVAGCASTCEAAATAGARRLIYASSCAVYGDNPNLPVSETSKAMPQSPYAASKLENEHHAAGLRSPRPGFAAVGLRFFNVFGPWQDSRSDYSAVIPKWIDAVLQGRRPAVYGDGSATRDFCFVGNVCEAIMRLGAAAAAPRHAVYNIGTGVQTSLSQLFAIVAQELRRAGVDLPFDGPERKPWRPGEILHSVGDISRAEMDFGYAPRVDLAGGIRLALEEQYGLRVVSPLHPPADAAVDLTG